jgi:DNA-binding transcriptional LysR family regulator
MPDRNIDAVPVELLSTLAVLLEARSVSGAAVKLGLTQSAVSKTLGRLRALFRDELFVRHARGLTPTPRALALEAPLRSILASVDELVTGTAFDPATAALDIRIAATDHGLAIYLAPAIAALRGRAPGIRIGVAPLVRTSLAPTLADGALDLAICGQDQAPPELESRRLGSERFAVAARHGHPRVRGKLTLDLFCALEHVLVSPGGPSFSGRVDAALAELDRRRSVVVTVTAFSMLSPLLATTDLVAVAPERVFLPHRDRLQVLEPPLRVAPLPMALLWHARTHRSAAHRWVRALIVECAPGASDR